LLEDFEVKKLGGLNLIVGKNNSGKSTVLEAIRIYAGKANPPLLAEILSEHDEEAEIRDTKLSAETINFPVEHFFTGRKFPQSDHEICIGEKSGESTALKLRIDKSANSDHWIKVSQNGKEKRFSVDDLDTSQRRGRIEWFEKFESIPCGFIPTRFISIDALADIWDGVLFTENEEVVKQCLEIISSDFENLAFVKGDPYSAFGPGRKLRRIAKVKLKNTKRPFSLNSMGDGMLRILQLSLNIFPAMNGFLLIDEFENGLHYSVQEKVWELLFDLANRFDIQVFATTHSWDCVDSFAKVAARSQNIEGVLFRVGQSIRTSDNGKVIATEFDKEKLATLTQADVDVR
jgi:AAA15 family ATPase/GTPase